MFCFHFFFITNSLYLSIVLSQRHSFCLCFLLQVCVSVCVFLCSDLSSLVIRFKLLSLSLFLSTAPTCSKLIIVFSSPRSHFLSLSLNHSLALGRLACLFVCVLSLFPLFFVSLFRYSHTFSPYFSASNFSAFFVCFCFLYCLSLLSFSNIIYFIHKKKRILKFLFLGFRRLLIFITPLLAGPLAGRVGQRVGAALQDPSLFQHRPVKGVIVLMVQRAE